MSVTLHTSLGDIKLELHCHLVPRSTANFLALCASGVYTNTRFHRVIPSFIIQTGDPTGTGRVSRAAFARRLADQSHPQLTFNRPGIVAFANAGKLSKSGVGSQFFITLNPSPHLDGTCTIIGHVINGFDVIRAIENVPLRDSVPLDDVLVQRVSIHANPFAEGQLDFAMH